jgi:hypothetical protein
MSARAITGAWRSKNVMSSSYVCPYLLGIELTQLVGPLKLFQARKAEKEPTLQLVETLNQKLMDPVPQESLRRLFTAMWPDLEAKLVTAQKAQTTEPPPQKLEEILDDFASSIRSMDQHLQRIEAALRIPQSRSAVMQTSVTLEAGAGEAAYQLARVGIRTKEQLDALVSSSELLKWIADTYVTELKRPVEDPLDATAVAFWGGLLLTRGFKAEVKQYIISQLRQSREYAAKHDKSPTVSQGTTSPP